MRLKHFLQLQSLRKCSTLNGNAPSVTEGYVPVYKFPYISKIALINRMKLYQTVLTGVSIPSLLSLKFVDVVDWSVVEAISTIGISGCCMLYPLGYFTDKFVGFIYYNESKSMTKIAYVDFWGRRKDVEIPTGEVVPLKELPTMPFDGLFLTLRCFSSKETWKINMKYGLILNEKLKNVL